MLTTVKGIYRNGHVELKEQPAGLREGRVLVTFLESDEERIARAPTQRISFGQYKGPQMSTEDDFRVAEWRDEEFE